MRCALRTEKRDFMVMNRKMTILAASAFAALGLSSCAVYDSPMYTSASLKVSGNGWSSSVAWTDARYDANGFPIFGYSYGQPVYGYTSSGVAVFSFSALTSSCCVPSWAPAHWYCGHWNYPRHIHRVSIPPKHPVWHHPGRKAPAVQHKPVAPIKPMMGHHPNGNHKSLFNHANRPGVGHRPGALHKPGAPAQPVIRPQMQRPQIQRPQMQLPQIQRPQMQRPQMQRPQGFNTPRAQGPAVSRPASMGRPAGGGGPGGHHGHR